MGRSKSHRKSKSQREREIGLWVRGSRSKALGRRSVRRFVDRRSRRRDRFVDRWVHRSAKSKSKAVIGEVGEVKVKGSLSLSLSLCVSPEMVWSENFHFKPFPGQSLQNTRSIENNFWKIYFLCVIKHPHLRKSISKSDLKPKQTQPKRKIRNI